MLRKIFVFTCLFAFIVAGAQAAVITVDDDPGLGDYTTIQDAVNAANPDGGDTIIVAAGDYDGFICDKPVEIIGDGARITSGVSIGYWPFDYYPPERYKAAILLPSPYALKKDGNPTGYGNASEAKISHIEIAPTDTATSLYFGVLGHNVDKVTISHMTISNVDRGINTGACNLWTISHNTLSQMTDGVLIFGTGQFGSTPTTASNNLVAFNTINASVSGISLRLSAGSLPIANNKIVHNKVAAGSRAIYLREEAAVVPPEEPVFYIENNLIGFNDFREGSGAIAVYPSVYTEIVLGNNTISRNLGDVENRGIDVDPPEDVSDFAPILPEE